MEKITRLFLILSFSLFIISTSSSDSCKPGSCDPNQGPQVRFPFRLINQHQSRCGHPGFELHCNARNQTILTLPRAGDFIVDLIDYKRQSLFIHDPASCLPNRAMNFSLSGSPFRPAYVTKFVFLNCSGGWEEYAASSEYYVPLACLGQGNSTVLAGSPVGEVPATCRRMGNVSVPPWWRVSQPDEWAVEAKEAFEVGWSEPRCGECEIRGGVCGYKHGDERRAEIGCSKGSGLSRRAKYGIIIGSVISVVLCIIGVGCYSCGMIKSTVRHQDPSDSAFIQLPVIRAVSGLDLRTIDSYPKTVLGQSLRLPSLSDNICPICLCDYQSKDTLRSIPECNHYFHVACIDEWLKLNATCPVCRKSPRPGM